MLRKQKEQIPLKLTDYANKIGEQYIKKIGQEVKKSKGQFFTPVNVAKFMINLFDINKQNIHLLDPGTGVGILTAAFCDRLLNIEKSVSLHITAYESDTNLTPYLQDVLNKCKIELTKSGHKVTFKIFTQDFILENADSKTEELFNNEENTDKNKFYDYIISNPPYYKLNKNSIQSFMMKEFVSGQPNIYPFFMALSLRRLKPDGEMVFITPRSFCSGSYYKKFREWLLVHGQFENIHLFESRKDIFDTDNILQETIITRITPKRNRKIPFVIVSKSKDKQFNDIQKTRIKHENILHRVNGDTFIKVPTSEADILAQEIVNNWKYHLSDFGLAVSTGPVVPFRAKKYLFSESEQDEKKVPFIWMHNLQGLNILWPFKKNGKESFIRAEEPLTNSLLTPTRNYIFLKRFTSKEQKRRLQAAVFLKSEFKYSQIGIENHINYIYKNADELSEIESYGIAAILNTAIVDNFFRSINGNTQVNATEIRHLPLPSMTEIRKIGQLVKNHKPTIGRELDNLVINVLGLRKNAIAILNKGN